MDLYLSHPGYSLGSVERNAKQTEQLGDLCSSAAALATAGFERHCVSPPEESCYDLARRALLSSRIETDSIDCIVYATCLPQNGSITGMAEFESSRDVKDLMNFPASHLQADFGMTDAFVIGLNQQACTGMLGSIRLARNMMLAEPDLQQALCITADRFPPGARYEQAYNLISDGAAVCQVSRRQQGYRILAAHQVTNGAMAQANDDCTVGSYFNYAHRTISETLVRTGLDMNDIRWVVPQNTNRKAWEILSGLLQVPADHAWFESMPRCGHVISADNIINLAELEHSGQLQNGDRILLFMAGFGSNWQCLVLERV